MQAEQAKLKSRRDDMIAAQGKRSAALGYGCNIIFSFFPSGLARLRRQTGREKEVGCGGLLPRAAVAGAPLPWAIILQPLRGAGTANQRLQATQPIVPGNLVAEEGACLEW